MRIRLNWARLCVAVAGLLSVCSVLAQAYPSKSIRLVVPFPPGGAVDFYARAVQPALAEALGQPVVIDNKAGASGMLGAGIVAQSAPDGYTLLLGNIASLAINVGIYDKMPYDPRKDFTHIVRTVDVNYVLVVHPSLPVKTFGELVQYAKANPGKLSYGSAGSGSLPHLGTELLKAQAGIDLVHVPYKGGGPMVTDALGGQIQVVLGDQANLMPHVQTGRLRALAVATTKRSANAANIPTIAESGLPGYDATAWQGLVGPAGMNAEVVKKINEAFNKVMVTPALRDKLIAGGLDPMGGTPAQFSRFIDSEITKWTKIAKDVGAKAE
ncbi:MAG: tripartite tricarboxylate transporter substrate binding protein [Burkholderiales bacterium]|nr:tripartite tricarboxylate transporter substrate binding protein [Burkholderiales bacterium]